MRTLVHYRWCIDIRHFYFTLQNNRPRSCWLIHHVMMEDSQKWAALFSSFLFRATTNNFFFLRTTTINQHSSGQWEIFSYFLSLVDVNINPHNCCRGNCNLNEESRAESYIHPSHTHWQKTTSSSSLYMPSPFVCLSVV